MMIATGFSRINLKHVLYLCAVVCLYFTSSYSYARTTLKICHEANNYPPYIYQQDNQAKGLLTDIIKTTAENAKVTVQFDAKSWNRCQKDVKAGNSHALFAMIKTP
nr:transporter substrate-binding domain-containing protein [Pseudoalteromonas phenolica]